MTDADTLCEMGFSRNSSLRALAKTNYKGVQVAMDWLLAHSEDPDIDDPFEEPKGHALGSGETTSQEAGSEGAEQGGEAPVAKSLKCDECGRILRTTEEAELHAVRTQHASFSESTDEKKPLTEEEKKEQMDKLQEKKKQRRLEREEQEKAEKIASEKNRRVSGKQITGLKQKFQEDEIKRAAEQRRREKMDDQLARQRVKDQIEKDRRDRAAKAAEAATQKTAAASQPQAAAAAPAPAAKKDYDSTRIQIRLFNGSAITQSFKASEPLAAVRLYVDMNRSDGNEPFNFVTNFPKKVFSEEDMEAPLSALGLVPSAVLMLGKR